MKNINATKIFVLGPVIRRELLQTIDKAKPIKFAIMKQIESNSGELQAIIKIAQITKIKGRRTYF